MKQVKVIDRDPDNLLVQWVPGGKTVTEILKEMKIKPQIIIQSIGTKLESFGYSSEALKEDKRKQETDLGIFI